MEIARIPASQIQKKSPRSTLKGRQVDPRARDAIAALLTDAPRDRQYLIEYLHRIQDRFGHISAAHIAALAEALKLSQVEVYETATFYHHFDVVKEGEAAPPAITVRVCESIGCAMAGADALYESLYAHFSKKNPDGSAEIAPQVRVIRAPCVGQCDCAPMAVVNQSQVKHASVANVSERVEEKVSQLRLSLDGGRDMHASSLSTHSREERVEGSETNASAKNRLHKTLAQLASSELNLDSAIATLNDANLRGLGGAGFPAGRKWKIVRGFAGPRLMVVNADEGEPGTFKDRYYLERNPWQFWEGMLIAAWAVEAEAVYVYLRDEYHALRDTMHAQCAELNDYLRRNFSAFCIKKIELRRGAGAYICGEESALIESVEGKRGVPRLRPPYIAEVGLFGRPTLAHNVETLYWVPEILRKGAAWWTANGRNGRTGLRTFSVSGRVREPGVKFAPAGITLRELIAEFCGGMQEGHTLYGYLPGGASGGILPASLADVPLDFDTLQPHGAFIGSAAIVVLSQHDKVKDVALNLMQFFAHESCGQCTPCRAGTVKATQLMQAKKWDQALLGELSQTMMDASICGLGQAAPNPLICAMKYFPQEFAES